MWLQSRLCAGQLSPSTPNWPNHSLMFLLNNSLYS
uniref:Uncharacterized protein n=1 Tax=Anguilla anguilla TaxID=7936 RepID=A0A0E9SYS2_ANGAN